MHLLRILSLVTVASLVACGGSSEEAPQDTSPEGRVKTRISEVFQLIKERKREQVAEALVYRFRDAERKFKDTLRWGDEDEKRSINLFCSRIESLSLRGAVSHVGFETEQKPEGTWYVTTVRFGKGDRARDLAMRLIEVNGKLLIGEVNLLKKS